MSTEPARVVVQVGWIAPDIDTDSEQFWDHLSRGDLWLPMCSTNGHRFFPPAPFCPVCGTQPVTGALSSGAGTVYSWVIVNIALSPEFTGDAPYTVIAVDLADGGRMLARYFGPVDALGDGVAVTFTPYQTPGGLMLCAFSLAEPSA